MPMIKTEDNAYRILLALSEGNKRFSDLLKEAKKASVAIELNRLERMKCVFRHVDSDSKPPTTTYSITKLGKDFLSAQAESRIPKLTLELERLKVVSPNAIKELKSKI
ncbi:MAG: winged helix-turn-helix transcriptional regulator [Nitrososphaerales archaeon]